MLLFRTKMSILARLSRSSSALRGLPWRSSRLDRVIRSKVSVSMESIKALRQRTGAPIKAVKQALEESSGEMEKAIESLRKLGASLATKRSGRSAEQGIIAVKIDERSNIGAMIELSCETDFVARTDKFQELANDLVFKVIEQENDSIDDISKMSEEDIFSTTTSLGEKIELRRIVMTQHQHLYKYIHRPSPNSTTCGQIGVLLALDGDDGDVGSRMAMHIAAANPKYLSIDSIPPGDMQRERDILMQMTLEKDQSVSKKPEHVIQRIVEGRLQKWYGDVVLEQQEMLVEPRDYSGKSRSVMSSTASSNPKILIKDFVRFEVGSQ